MSVAPFILMEWENGCPCGMAYAIDWRKALAALLSCSPELGREPVRLSDCWLTQPGSQYRPISGRAGCIHLRHYSAAYREWGDGPPIVLIPGLAGGMDLLAPLAQKLSADFRVIAYQLRGEDDPFVLRRRFGIRNLVDDLEEFLDQHGLEAPTMLGVSFGGIVALEFAIRFPGRLNRLIVQGVGAKSERGL